MRRGIVWSAWVTRLAWPVAFLLSMGATYLGMTISRSSFRTRLASDRRKPAFEAPINPFAKYRGSNLVAFVVTAADCGWSNSPTLIDAVGSLRQRLQAAHGRHYAHITIIAVVLDDTLDVGVQFLSKFGRGRLDSAFDQVVVGGSWMNEEIVRFVWREHAARAASPQVIVVERSVNTDSYLSESVIGVQKDHVVANPRGTAEILDWIRNGAPLSTASIDLATGSRDLALER